MPDAQGLFRRAIAQSGAAHHAISVATAQRVGQRLTEKLGVAATREGIAAVPLDRLVAAQAELQADLGAHPDPERWGAEVALSMMPWQPVIDGKVIPSRPIDRIAAGASADVDVMVGTNTDEHRLFLVPGGAIDQVTAEGLAAVLAAYGLPVEPALAAYRAAHPRANPGDLLAAIQTDWFWRVPAIRLADAHATSVAATYMYELAWRSPQLGGRLGACHALEIAFVFDTLGNGTEPFWGTSPPQQLADTMHAAWAAFATNGDCGWPKYDLSRRPTMRFDTASKVVDDPRSWERELWEGVR
jgi:carboxylesterase type B